MKHIRDISHIVVNGDYSLSAIQQYSEDEYQVEITMTDLIPEMKRGYVCDIEVNFRVSDTDNPEYNDIFKENLYELLLVRTDKLLSFDYAPEFKYIFFKK